MTTRYLILALSLLMAIPSVTFSQPDPQRMMQPVKVSGKVTDKTDATGLPGAHLIFRHMRDTSRVFRTTTDNNGQFSINMPRGRYVLRTSYVGYKTDERQLTIIEENNNLGTIALDKADAMLGEVTVAGEAVQVRVKSDTLQFDAQAYKTNPDATAEDLLRKLPGVTITPQGVQAQGETVRRVLVDGQEFFGDDPNIALRNLPAEMISQVEVFDQMSDQSRLTGFDDGQRTKTINIVTRQDRRSGQFGKVYGGFGENDRFQAGLTTNIFLGKRRISLLGMSNNINQQNFSTEDLSGFFSSGRGGGGGGGMRFGMGGGGGGGFNRGDFLIGQQNGNNTTHSYGINYTDVWMDKLNANMSYFFNLARNNTNQLLERQYFLNENLSRTYNETSKSSRDNYNHRFNGRFEYKIDDNNTIILIPRFSMQKTNSDNFTDASMSMLMLSIGNHSLTTYDREWDGINFGNTLIYRLRLNEKGRSLSTRFNNNINNNELLYTLDAMNWSGGIVVNIDTTRQQSTTKTLNQSHSGNITYTEPAGKNGMIQVSYNLSYTSNESERQTNDFDIIAGAYNQLVPELSSDLNSGYLTHRAGAGYRFRKEKYNFLAELAWQEASLEAQQELPYTSKTTFSYGNLLPSLQFNYNFSRSETARLMYRTFTNGPSASQLSDVVDNTNPLLLSSGNPTLQQSYSHFLTASYNLTRIAKGKSFMGFIFMNMTNNYIGNSLLIARNDTLLPNGYTLPAGAQYSRPENLQGLVNIRSSLTYGFPIRKIKSNINLTGGFAWTRTPSLINNTENFSNSYTTTGGATLSSNISQNLDFTLSYRLNHQNTQNKVRPQTNNNYFYHVGEARVAWTIKSNWVLRSDLNNLYYTGLGDNFNENYWLWNINVGRKLFENKRGELTLGVYDLLNQNRSVTQNVTDTYIESARYNVLNRFVMLTFTYNFRNYGAQQQRTAPQQAPQGFHREMFFLPPM
ncbi:MAG TPA: outer membrane beta-barrel protein [Bacteroidales bacterium]|nr:outer membrane beta-barrel protein [Bacteroidales bacterium]